jgi:hypothetical protein
MNQQQRKQMYPVISHNSKERCEQRWEDSANAYGDIDAEWQISIGNGKRLRQKWTRNGGIAHVPNRYGETQTIYNQTYDREWQKAIDELRPPRGLTRQVAMKYDRSFQPDGDDNFYTTTTYY